MKSEFVPYNIALAMKSLGFDEGCLRYYFSKNEMRRYSHYTNDVYDDDCYIENDNDIIKSVRTNCTAPLYQQAFRWFREKHNLFSKSYQEKRYELPTLYSFLIEYDEENIRTESKISYKEAQDACLKRLIKIVKENKPKQR